jgi:hypothetical protein
VKYERPLILFCLVTNVDGKDDLELMIDCIVEGCNDALVTNQEGMDGQQ